MSIPFEPTRSYVYKAARYELLPQIGPPKLAVKGPTTSSGSAPKVQWYDSPGFTGFLTNVGMGIIRLILRR